VCIGIVALAFVVKTLFTGFGIQAAFVVEILFTGFGTQAALRQSCGLVSTTMDTFLGTIDAIFSGVRWVGGKMSDDGSWREDGRGGEKDGLHLHHFTKIKILCVHSIQLVFVIQALDNIRFTVYRGVSIDTPVNRQCSAKAKTCEDVADRVGDR